MNVLYLKDIDTDIVHKVGFCPEALQCSWHLSDINNVKEDKDIYEILKSSKLKNYAIWMEVVDMWVFIKQDEDGKVNVRANPEAFLSKMPKKYYNSIITDNGDDYFIIFSGFSNRSLYELDDDNNLIYPFQFYHFCYHNGLYIRRATESELKEKSYFLDKEVLSQKNYKMLSSKIQKLI